LLQGSQALQDKILTLDESDLLDIITQNLKITQETIDLVTAHFDGDAKIEVTPEQAENFRSEADPAKDKEIFKNVLIQALADEKISKDELEIIKALTDLLNIQKDARTQIYSDVKEEIERRFEEERKDYMMERFSDLVE